MSALIPFVSGEKTGTGHLEDLNAILLECLHRSYEGHREICVLWYRRRGERGYRARGNEKP